MNVKLMLDPRNIAVFVDHNEAIYFDRITGSAPRKETLPDIVSGINHMLAWLQDTEGLSQIDLDLKNKYLNEIRIIFRDMKRLMGSVTDECVEIIRDRENNINDKKDAEKRIFHEVIFNLRDEFYDFVIAYVKNNTVHNTETDDAHLSLTEDIISVYSCLSTALKIIYFYFMSICSSIFKAYCSDLTFPIIKRIQEAFLRYYYMRDRIKYNELVQQDFTEIIYKKTYDYVVKEHPDESLFDKFTISGYSRNTITNDVIDEILLTINKLAPIKKAEKSVSVQYKYGDPYNEYALADLSTVKYIQSTLRYMVTNKFRVTLKNNITKTNTRGLNDVDQYKQELLMEKNNTTVTERKKSILSSVRNFLKKFFSNVDELETDIPNKNCPLNEYLVTSFMLEIGAPVDILKMMDDDMYIKILKYIVYVLTKHNEEFTDMMLAIFCESNDRKSADKPIFKPENEAIITSMTCYIMDPDRVLSTIYNVIGRTYTNVHTQYMVDIEDTFIKFMKLQDEDKIRLVNDYIYDYEDFVEEGTYIDSNEYSDDDGFDPYDD